ncbi:hypothetical protein Scep_021947 [Stephania cephalantha]|uniref:Uncharacterized protein n=1 Tax=Stephania cephalantha TaxID=152367 RepID=A0AAP0HX98_9MAGN
MAPRYANVYLNINHMKRIDFQLPHVPTSRMTVAGYFVSKGSHVLLSRTGLGRNHIAWVD